MRRARSPMVRQRPLMFSSVALLLVLAACSPHSSLAVAEEHHATPQQVASELQSAERLLAPAPAPTITIGEAAPANAPEAEAPAVSLETAAPANPSAPKLPGLKGVSFLGLPPLPAVPLPYKDNSAPAPMIAESGALAPAPSKDDFVTGKGLVSSVANTYIQGSALPPAAKSFAEAAVSGAPLPSASQILASFTQAIPAEAPAPAAAIRVAGPSGKALVSLPFPTADTIFSALEKLGRRRLLAEEAPAPAPAVGSFPALPGPTNLQVDGNQANPNDDTSFAESQWYKTSDAEPQQAAPQQPAAQLQAQPLPQPEAQPQPQPAAQLQAQPAQPQNMQLEALPGGAPAPVALLPVQPPQPGPLAPAFAPIGSPGLAPAPKLFGPIPSEVKVFTERLANFLGAEARQQLPKRVEVNAAGRRRLAQDNAAARVDEPLSAEPLAAQAPVTAPGGEEGPRFQALPEPAPLPPLPRPTQPEAAMSPAGAPAGSATVLQARTSSHAKPTYFGTFSRRLQQLPTPESFEPAVPEETQAFAAQAPTSAPGGEEGPRFQALPEPAPLPPLPRPTQPMSDAPAPAPMAGASAEYQARPSTHAKPTYFGTVTRRLQQLPTPESFEPAVPVETHAFAAEAPVAAPGGEEGPRFQALPEPAPLPPLPRPTQPMSEAPGPAPMSGPEASAEYQARPSSHAKPTYFGTFSRRLQQLPTPQSFEPAVPEETQAFAAQAPTSAPGGEEGPRFQALPEPAPLPPLPRPTQPMSDAPAPAPMAEASADYQARPSSHAKPTYFGTFSRRLQQLPAPESFEPAVPEETQAFAAQAPMAAPGGEEGPRFQALPEPVPLPPLPRPTQPEAAMSPASAPAGSATVLQAVQGKKGKQHVNPPAKLTNTPTAGRRLQATDAPAPAPEQGPAARRDMPPLPPMMPQGPQPGAMPAQGGPQSSHVGVFQSNDPNNNDAPAVQIPKEYQSGVIDAIKQAIPSYISNALGAGR